MRHERPKDTFPIITGRAWAFGIDVPVEQIVPAEARDAEDIGRYLMTPVDPDFPSRVRAGDVLVGGSFALGTQDDTPVRALLGAGIGAVVASSLDRTFARLAVEAGLPAVEVYEALVIHTGAILRVDLETARVVNMSSGDRYPIRNLDDATLARYRLGAS